ncbi:enoyl-CoA hydratase/isomerase family protein [Roseomonas sp. GC11]|uniref:enoyl-CoA hydratase/isomerase family protein n=1 Tax=Roseomonas sp. GC11 TaxID=2950546 RepID=UPI00210A6E0F|nr:enoyl-CoA hydratase/isomerase family protein [Roseomonas sp. GC11]MCQ4160000.1 enoyl-CoA hydratase/isomerase family protein [Roseomonas sp. GC11]
MSASPLSPTEPCMLPGLADLQRFLVTVEEHVATVTMNAPPVNAQDRLFRQELLRVFDVLHDSPAVRAIVLTGAGRAFSAGADLRERPNLAGEAGAYPGHNRLVRAGFDAVMDCGKPVIAAVNGAAIGAGCVLALCCDILLVAEDAFLAMTEVDVGLAGGVRHVMRFFGQSDARLLIYTARRVHGPELLRMNAASACLPRDRLLEEAQAIARQIAAKSPLAVQAAKRSFQLTEEMPLRDGYRYEQTQTVALATTEDTKEAQRAFAEKRKPIFQGK